MLNEKILINEYDNTTAVSATTDSTDIAFIPGFTYKNSSAVNSPLFFKTVKDFEAEIGDKPYKFKRNVYDLGVVANEFDRGYLFAKELLRQGMPVYYYPLSKTKEEKLDSSINIETNESYVEDATLKESLDRGVNIYPGTNSNPDSDDLPGAYFSCTYTFSVNNSEENERRVAIILEHTSESEFSGTSLSVKYTLKINGEEFKSFELGKFIELPDGDNTLELSVEVEMGLNWDTNHPFRMSCSASIDIKDYFELNDAIYDEISDKSLYSVKYITSGGYPSLTKTSNLLAKNMITAATRRGDAVALIDASPDDFSYSFSSDSTSDENNTYYLAVSKLSSTDAELSYGAAMYPWAKYSSNEPGVSDILMPASYAYLRCVAKAIKSSPNWLAMAGTTRGLVPDIKTLKCPEGKLSNTIAENMQPKFGSENNQVSVNCITEIRPYGLTIWGNRTLKPLEIDKGTVATCFLNTRNMISDIKKLLYTTAKATMFEQDDENLWLNFKDAISPFLKKLQSGGGISDFQIIRSDTKYDGTPLTRGEMSAIVKIYPIHAIEYFELSVEINDNDVTVS